MHPNAKGVERIVKGIMPEVEKLITEIQKTRKEETGEK